MVVMGGGVIYFWYIRINPAMKVKLAEANPWISNWALDGRKEMENHSK